MAASQKNKVRPIGDFDRSCEMAVGIPDRRTFNFNFCKPDRADNSFTEGTRVGRRWLPQMPVSTRWGPLRPLGDRPGRSRFVLRPVEIA